ncbi:c-type cytochrome [Myroides sp. JBRI-B21084]|uniref:c-type cytochrome n=1 Tax=Myroides sp. JBRI-B21084 TaxID=3119977 RepID=UPI0026E12D1D|nr:c-type cytochrome [Paenimyroides cloacae]WKW47030.1 c-type cytochrome [Paenimyroides cloacae]
MKKKIVFALFAATVLVSCNKEKEVNPSVSDTKYENLNPEEQLVADGQELFESNKAACYSCHKVDQKVIGPSVKEIAEIYKEQNGDLVAFLRKKAKPIVDPTQYNVMETNFAILKTMSDEEIKSLEAYILSTVK